MKIGVIGATGKAGRMISGEALRRGHEVTAVVRSRAGVGDEKLAVLEKDLFDLAPEDFTGMDAVVSAFGVPFNTGGGEIYQKVTNHLIALFKNLPETRLLVVGGAASLYQEGEEPKLVLETFPEQLRTDPADMVKSLEILRGSDISWTFFSPAVTFEPWGRRTGKYVLGGDSPAKNSDGESYISYADYAVALVDEIENKQFVGKRFTAASDSRRRPKERPYYGIHPKKPEFEGMSQYRGPLNYELEGKKLRLVMDNGKKYFINFHTGDTLEWFEYGGQGTLEHYDCGKTDDLTYFVNFEFTNVKPRTNFTLVLDMEQRLVTMVKTVTGFHEKFIYLCESEFFFGAIDIPGCALPEKRHGHTSDLLGKRIHWHYSPEIEIVHVYYSLDHQSVTAMPGQGWADLSEEEYRAILERDPYTEPAVYIKIKDGLYFVSVIEQAMSKRGFTGNSLLFLIDTLRVHDVGRSFGHAGMDKGKVHPENYLFEAYGDFVYSDGKLEEKLQEKTVSKN